MPSCQRERRRGKPAKIGATGYGTSVSQSRISSTRWRRRLLARPPRRRLPSCNRTFFEGHRTQSQISFCLCSKSEKDPSPCFALCCNDVIKQNVMSYSRSSRRCFAANSRQLQSLRCPPFARRKHCRHERLEPDSRNERLWNAVAHIARMTGADQVGIVTGRFAFFQRPRPIDGRSRIGTR